MPTIYIAKGEKRCCNCKNFRFYGSPKAQDVLFVMPPNIGYCEIGRKTVQAVRRSCKEFVVVKQKGLSA